MTYSCLKINLNSIQYLYQYSSLWEIREMEEQIKWYPKYGHYSTGQMTQFPQQIKDMEKGQLGEGDYVGKKELKRQSNQN